MVASCMVTQLTIKIVKVVEKLTNIPNFIKSYHSTYLETEDPS